eukprot:TRINITY_DN4126_c0_g1_i1.p1 TRINITY_DN4126_c0_g1~~TRINITY_DN4126_c0_g1_i1.p1  ORF type:complete len:74 (-),score=5.06 TRINITY_DN4126_c0_g1_i1:10-231(-)
MVFIILYKWFVNWEERDYAPPSLITVLIGVVLSVGNVDKTDRLFTSVTFQEVVQTLLFLIMFCSVPILFVAKP